MRQNFDRLLQISITKKECSMMRSTKEGGPDKADHGY